MWKIMLLILRNVFGVIIELVLLLLLLFKFSSASFSGSVNLRFTSSRSAEMLFLPVTAGSR